MLGLLFGRDCYCLHVKQNVKAKRVATPATNRKNHKALVASRNLSNFSIPEK